MRNRIYAIVEGEGEVKAVPVLVKRCLNQYGFQETIFFEKAYKCDNTAFFNHKDTLVKTLRRIADQSDCGGVLIFYDLDDGCAVTLLAEWFSYLSKQDPFPFSIAFACPVREFEAWFLAGVKTLEYSKEPEAIRDAKGWLRKRHGYKPTQHQAEYCKQLNWELTMQKSRSFRRFCHAVEELSRSISDRQQVITPQVK
jgi:hypothetical protein